MADVAVEVFTHNLWANLKLLDACSGLSDGDLAATVPGTYGSVGDTLVHLLGAEGRYVAEFDGGRREPAEGEPFPGFVALRAQAKASGQALIDIASADPANRILKGTYRGTPYEMGASILLLQAVNHATEHRSHVMSILTQSGVDPMSLRMDAIAYFQAGAHA